MTDWTEAKMESLSEPSAGDVDQAAAAWRTDAPPDAKNLADAETPEDGSV